jgi:O-antigen/teichoic acid export membrane protein
MKFRSIISNFTMLAFGEFSSKAFGFLTTVYLARVLGVEGFGFYGFVSSVSTYVILFSNFGIEQYSAQRLSVSNSSSKDNLIGTVLGTRSMLSVLFIFLFIVFGYFYSNNESEFLFFIFQTTFILAFAFNLQFYFVALKQIKILALLKIGTSLAIFLCSVFFIANSSDLSKVSLINGIITLSFFMIGLKYAIGRKDWNLKLPTIKNIRLLLKTAAPLGISALMIQIYHSADIVFLGFTNPGVELGYYTGAYKIITVLSSIPGIFYLVFLPELSKITSKYFSSQHTKRYIVIVIFCGTLITVFCYLYSVQLITVLLGEEYRPAVDVFHILLINVFLIYANVALAQLLIAWNQHKKYLVIVSAGATVNIIFNIIFIPLYGIIGAAIATVFAELAVLIVTIYYHIRFHGLFSGMGKTI